MCSILFNWIVAILYSEDKLHNKRLMIFGLIVNIAVLVYFKYAIFIIDNFNYFLSSDKVKSNIIISELPIGISFFTFTQMAFLVDMYYKPKQRTSIADYSLFVNFFPHLIAGPMLYHKDIMPQFKCVSLKSILNDTFFLGLLIFSIGLIKKILIADPLGFYADQLFDDKYFIDSHPRFFAAWFGAIAYTFQIYFDFSGYTDMAIGLGLMFGILLPFNFNSPYKATSIIEYWQRWHMSLTRYILQYIYNPIAIWAIRKYDKKGWRHEIIGNMIFPNLLVFLIVGFWHGANWTFVFWGLMHGSLIVINHLWRIRNRSKTKSEISWLKFLHLKSIAGWVLTFGAVIITFVMFRADSISQAIMIYEGMLGINGLVMPAYQYVGATVDHEHWLGLKFGSSSSFIGLVVLAFVVILIPINSREIVIKKGMILEHPFMRSIIIVIIGMLATLSIFALNRTTTFLYFNF